MISDEEYIRQSIESNLLYCGSILELTYSLGFSFLSKDIAMRDEIKNFYNRFKRQMQKTLKISNQNISQELIDSNVLYTKYTIPLYELTEELTENKADIEIVTNLMMLKSGTPIVSNELLNEVTTINEETLKILKEYIDFTTYIHNQVLKSNLFIYKYGLYIEEIRNRASFYYDNLHRILNKEQVSIILFDKTIEGIKDLMERNALFINGFVNQSEDGIILEARNFANEFHNLDLSNITTLSEEELQNTYNTALNLIDSFINFVTRLIEKVLNKNLQFIVVPAFLDICLREANDFKYNLRLFL